MTEREIYRLFVDTMAAFLHGNTIDLPSDMVLEDYKALYKLAKRQSLTGALHEATAPFALIPPMKERLRRDAFLMLAVYEQQQATACELKEIFTKHGIEHLFFKGAVIRQYYRSPAMRSMGDIDVYIRVEQREEVRRLLEGNGYSCEPETGEVWVYRKDGCIVEVHTIVKRFDVYRQDSVVYDTVWQDARLLEDVTYRFTDEAEAVHTIMHLAVHFCGGGCGLRQLMDVAVWCLRCEDEVFWERVMTTLKPYGLYPFAQRLLWLCQAWFGVSAPSVATPLDSDTEEELLTRFLSEGTFGTDDRVVLSRMRAERHEKHGKVVTWIRWIFPSPSYIRRRYVYAQRHGWLTPVAYVHRLAAAVTKHRDTHSRRMQYAKEHEAELQRELQFFEKLGL